MIHDYEEVETFAHKAFHQAFQQVAECGDACKHFLATLRLLHSQANKEWRDKVRDEHDALARESLQYKLICFYDLHGQKHYSGERVIHERSPGTHRTRCGRWFAPDRTFRGRLSFVKSEHVEFFITCQICRALGGIDPYLNPKTIGPVLVVDSTSKPDAVPTKSLTQEAVVA